MIMTLYNLCTKKGEIIKEYVENEKYFYIDKVYGIEDTFLLPFFELCIENTAIDAYDYFVELECENNFFYDNIIAMSKERGRRIYKAMAIHHTIKLLRKKRKELDVNVVKRVLFEVFDFNESEKKLFCLLYSCACDYEAEFSRLFSLTLAKYVFGKNKISAFSLAFIENFCYNAYSNFMQSFTKYISLNVRIKRAAN